MSDPVLYDLQDHILVLTMNRPETRNAIGSIEELDFFVDLCRKASADKSVRAVILTGAGKAFAAGGNIKQMRDGGGIFGGVPSEQREIYRRTVQHLARAIWSIDVPTIAAVNGPAVGQGCDLACLCDIRIAAASARFSVPFVKLGLIPGDGGSWLMPRVVGRSRAAELIFTGDMIDAETAAQWGLVSRVVADADLLAEARALAGRIAENPPVQIRMAKQLLRAAEHGTFDTLMEMSAAMQAVAHSTADHMEALDAFFEKRPGRFEGR